MRKAAGDVENVSLFEQECPEISDNRCVHGRRHVGDCQRKFLGWTREVPFLGAMHLDDEDVVVVRMLKEALAVARGGIHVDADGLV